MRLNLLIKMNQGEDKAYKASINIPFLNERQALVALRSLKPDLVLKSKEIDASCLIKDNVLCLSFSGTSNRVLRVTISTLVENLKTIIECIDEFGSKERYHFV